MHSKCKKRLSKKNIIHLAVLTVIYLIFVTALTRFEYAYGSTLDWGGQHYAIPDYFRKRFYETGQLFPSFAANIGSGENIYNLSYYGLFSPIILFSYLLPFVKMSTYIQAVSIVGVIVSTVIFYRWMTTKFDDKLSFLLSLAFMLSGPLIFHSHRHIMFVSYMPFLLLAFKAAEDYMEGRKKYRLVIYTFLLIMTCYFFAVSGIAAITVYAVYVYLKKQETFQLKDFFRTAFHYAGRILTAIMMSGVLILPTCYCLLSGRDKGNVKVDLSVLLPTVSFKFFAFATYSMGLGIFLICAIASGILSKKKHRAFMGITLALLIIFPIFVYLLNGTLYVDSKVLIPFMPLGVLTIGEAYCDIVDGKFKWKIIIPITAIFVFLGVFISHNSHLSRIYAVIDLFIIIICLGIYYRKKLKSVLNIAVLGCMTFATVYCNFHDKLVTIDDLNMSDGEAVNTLSKTAENSGEIVRTNNLLQTVSTANLIYNGGYYVATEYSSLHNKLYNNFYFNEIYNENEFRNSALTTASRNVLWNIYMSEKYIITDSELNMAGYTKTDSCENLNLYENDNVFPLGYADSQLMSLREYKSLEYPYSLDALMRYTVVDENLENVYQPKVSEVTGLTLPKCDEITLSDGVYKITSEDDLLCDIKLPESIDSSKIMLISFDVNNTVGKKDDVKITVNGQINTLTDPDWKYYNGNTTFNFTLSCQSGNLDTAEVCLGSGDYTVDNIRCYIMDSDFTKDCGFVPDTSNTLGDVISGTVTAESDGYFNISIPYSDGFTVFVNGEEVQCEKVDTAFVGFKIQKGSNQIEIRFRAPFLTEGEILSGVGILIFVILTIYERIENNTKKHDKD